MSLKSRLRIFIVALLISVVSALSALNVYSMVMSQSSDALQRMQMIGDQINSFLLRRVPELVDSRQPEPRSTDDVVKLWADIVRNDDELRNLLENNLANSKEVIVEILVAGPGGEILADSIPSRVGHRTYELPDFQQWNGKSPWGKLIEVFSYRQDYQYTPVSLGLQTPEKSIPVLRVKVIASSVFLRERMLPQIRTITLIFLGALLLSTILAVIVSNLALRPLATISREIDRITKGEFDKAVPVGDGNLKEYAVVQSKLNVLGQQFRGAKEDAVQLRTNIEQLLERLDEVVLLFDRDDRLVMAGRAAERLLGRGRWEMMGRSVAELFPANSPLGAVIKSAIELRQPLKDQVIAFERGAGLAPGRVLLNVEMLEGFPRHDRIGTLITLRDVESRRQIQSQLDISTRLAAISRLTGGVAHEIKNPLQAIRVHLEVLRARLSEQEPDAAPEIETIDREIMRLDRVVKTFLDFTRPVDLQMQDVEMTALVREVLTLVGPSADKQQVKIDVEMGTKELFVHGDRDLLQQAILNVVVNGIEAMKKGGRLKAQVRESSGECNVIISDEGPGIAPEIRDKVFNLYFSTKGKGSGIGLAMTFRVVQLHNGTIDFTSEAGNGTTFRLRVPSVEREPYPNAETARGTKS